MLKKMKFISLALLLVLAGLSFMSRNNFRPQGPDFFEQTEDMVSVKDFKSYIKDSLVSPITACYGYERFMKGKCYASMVFEFTGDYKDVDDDQLLYANTFVYGKIAFNDCGIVHHVCDVRLNYEKKELQVQESFLGGWEQPDAYLKRFCEIYQPQQAETGN